MTIQEFNELSPRNLVSYIWGDNIIQAIDNQITTPMTMNEFMTHCTACGGNWGGMLLTGLQKLYPEVYEAIPDDMGMFAFRGICETLALLGITE